MKSLILIISIIFQSCSSNSKKYEEKIKELEDKIEQMSSNKDNIKKKTDKEPENKESLIELKNYNSFSAEKESITHKIKLGKNYGKDYNLYITNKGSFLIHVSQSESIEKITLLIPHKTKSPEFLNFIKIKEGFYQTKADEFSDNLKFQLTISVENKKDIIYNLEAKK